MTRTYNPKKVLVILGGVELKGFAEDSIIDIEPSGDGITSIVGADGEVTRTIDPDKRFKVSIKLSASSSSNDFLSATHAADLETGKGVLPLLVKDLSGRTVFFAGQAWITKYPKFSREKKAGSNEWQLETGPADILVGGNS